jgi:hypothetical protein
MAAFLCREDNACPVQRAETTGVDSFIVPHWALAWGKELPGAQALLVIKRFYPLKIFAELP